MLHDLFSEFDEMCDTFGVYKVSCYFSSRISVGGYSLFQWGWWQAAGPIEGPPLQS